MLALSMGPPFDKSSIHAPLLVVKTEPPNAIALHRNGDATKEAGHFAPLSPKDIRPVPQNDTDKRFETRSGTVIYTVKESKEKKNSDRSTAMTGLPALSAESPRIEQGPAVVGHLERRSYCSAEELLEGLQSAREMLVLLHDSPVLLFEVVDVLGSLQQDGALFARQVRVSKGRIHICPSWCDTIVTK